MGQNNLVSMQNTCLIGGMPETDLVDMPFKATVRHVLLNEECPNRATGMARPPKGSQRKGKPHSGKLTHAVTSGKLLCDI